VLKQIQHVATLPTIRLGVHLFRNRPIGTAG
jgi:hypothetical protein